MERNEQVQFIEELMANVGADILEKNIPLSWDGIELRWFIRDHFDKVVFGGWKDKRSRRYKEYENYCIVNNLL